MRRSKAERRTVSGTQNYDPSPVALRPLHDAFWSKQGWKQPAAMPTGMELTLAVASGVMFSERRELDHDGWVAATRAAVSVVAPVDVEQAFVSSLHSRRLDLRSGCVFE